MNFFKKVIITFILILNSTLAEDEIGVEGFEALFLKIASEAFFSEYENEKNITYSNRDKINEMEEKLKILYKATKELKEEIKDVKELKKQLSSMLSEFSPTTLGKVEKIENFDNSNLEFENLKLELQTLKNRVAFLSEQKENIQNKKIETKEIKEIKQNEEIFEIKKLRLISSNAKVRETPFLNSKVIKTLNRDEVIEVESCDKFGWCKIKTKEEYIEKYLFLEIEN